MTKDTRTLQESVEDARRLIMRVQKGFCGDGTAMVDTRAKLQMTAKRVGALIAPHDQHLSNVLSAPHCRTSDAESEKAWLERLTDSLDAAQSLATAAA